MEPFVRYALIAAACILSGVVAVLVINYKRVQGARDVRLTREDVLSRLFIRKIEALGNDPESTDMRQMLKKLKKIMKDFFSELFEISHEFDYVELNEVLGKKGVDESVRKDIIDYSMKIDEFEYSGRAITEDEFLSLVDGSVGIIRNVTQKKDDSQIESLRKEVSEMQKRAEAEVPRKAHVSTLKLKISGIVGKYRAKRVHEGDAVPSPGKQRELPKADEKAEEKPVEEKKEDKDAVPKPQEKRKESVEEERVPVPEKPKEEHIPSKEEDGRIERIRKLLLLSEQSVEADRHEDAMEDYLELREIYDSLPAEKKMEIPRETKRIITLYNSLLSEYKNTLSKMR